MIAATLLMHMSPEQSFWTLVALLDNPMYLRYDDDDGGDGDIIEVIIRRN